MSSGVGAAGQAGVRDRDGQVEAGLVRGDVEELLVQRRSTKTYEPTPSRIGGRRHEGDERDGEPGSDPAQPCIGLSERPCSPRRAL